MNWGSAKESIPQGIALGLLLFLIYANNMPAQVQCGGSLLQFAGDTCLICCGNSNEDISRLLTEDLTSLSQWIAVECRSI